MYDYACNHIHDGCLLLPPKSLLLPREQEGTLADGPIKMVLLCHQLTISVPASAGRSHQRGNRGQRRMALVSGIGTFSKLSLLFLVLSGVSCQELDEFMTLKKAHKSQLPSLGDSRWVKSKKNLPVPTANRAWLKYFDWSRTAELDYAFNAPLHHPFSVCQGPSNVSTLSTPWMPSRWFSAARIRRSDSREETRPLG